MPVTRANKANENAVVGDGNQKTKTNLPIHKHQPLCDGRAALIEVSNNLVKAEAAVPSRLDPKIKGTATFFSSLKNVKPKVDSYWKKSEAPLTATDNNGKRHNTHISPPKLVTAKSVKLAEVEVPQLITIRADAQSKKTDVVPKRRLARRQESIENRIIVIRHATGKATATSATATSAKATSAKATSATVTTSSSEPESSGMVLKKPNFTLDSLIKLAAAAKAKRSSARLDAVSHSAMMLPHGVYDIDQNDATNLHLEPEYAKEIYIYLQDQEKKYQIPPQFLKNQKEVTPKMRTVLIDWINEVTLQFHLFTETYYLTVDIIDRYLNVSTETTRKNLQLVGVSAMFMACKYEEMYPPMLKDFVFITDDTYTPREIIKMECKILRSLNFDMSVPVVIHFIRRFSKAADLNQTEHNMCKYFVELTSVEYSMTHYLRTHLAAAAVCMALKLKSPLLPNDQLWSLTMQFYTKYELSDLLPVIKQMAEIVLRAPTAKEQSVFIKYSSHSFDKVASNAAINGPVMKRMCDDTAFV